MVRTHPSTPEQRAQWTAYMLAHRGEYGVVSRLSHDTGVSRPTLYAWRSQAEQALRQTFARPAPPLNPPTQDRQVLTVWIAHSSARDIQTCFPTLRQQGIGLTTITAIMQEAEQRALQWLATHMPASARAVALDEIYANDRHGAYLNVVDVHSGAVWASAGPLPADSESWTLLLWEAQDRGLVWNRLVMDDGAAMRAACRVVTPHLPIQGDQWHVLHSCAAVQGRLDRNVRDLRERTFVVARQAARVASGQRPKGPNPQTDIAAHAVAVSVAQRVTDAVRYLTQELRRVLAVVVVDRRGVLNATQRQAELEAVLGLLCEVADGAPGPQQAAVRKLHATLTAAVPGLLTFVDQLAHLQADLGAVLDGEWQALLAWAWLRKRALGWTSAAIVAAIPATLRAAARVLLAAWDDAVWVSSAVERWHSIVRVHLSVHRTLSPGQLALLAVWHNHRVFKRGIHKGQNPLQLSGIADAPTDWLVALGYPPAEAVKAPALPAPTVALAA